jgi:beta-lactamase class A
MVGLMNRCPLFKSLALLSLAFFVLAPAGQASENDLVAQPFAALEAKTKSRIGVAALDVSTKRKIEYRAEEAFLMCSTFKLLAAAAVLKRVDENKEKLDRFVKYGEKDLMSYAPVTRAHLKEGGMTVEALCGAAMQQSDNTAANLLLDTLGGPKGVTEFARSLGDKFTRLDRKEPELNAPAADKEMDTTRPAAISDDLQGLLMTDVLSEASRTRLEKWMQGSETGLQLIRTVVPTDWKTGDKTGRSSEGATNDVAILRPPMGGPIFIAVYTVKPEGTSEERSKLVADAAKIALDALKK